MSRNPEVDRWLEAYDNPMKPVVAAMRELILAHDARIDEAIKWQAPTFIYKGNIASFFPKAKKHASLMFHKGAEIPGTFPNLQGDGRETRSFKVHDLGDLEEKADELKSVFTAWCTMRDG
ncbi:DUF1801 domain-containing protein [Nitratireductor sp. XY-223]|uniref:DUF1801 domain-containing protein n=1 Tax=Nitratireductor sp. XY-223 TaxID=2561926 RepID=UPI0010AA2981|nr:DUF1801 domain-containing protein [Nitratireductor sp. XY-223]